jgi:hypothetical protein
MHQRAQIERILGSTPSKVKVGKLFSGFVRQVVTNCDNFATGRLGIRHIMANHKNGQTIRPGAIENKLAKLMAQSRIQTAEGFVQQQGPRLRQQHA